MLSMYAQYYKTHTVVFTSTESIISYATSLGHTVVTDTAYYFLHYGNPIE